MRTVVTRKQAHISLLLLFIALTSLVIALQAGSWSGTREVAAAALTPTGSSQAYEGIVNTRALNVRSGPGVEYDRIGHVSRNDQLRVTGHKDCDGDWLSVVTPAGLEGWVSARYVNLDADCPDDFDEICFLHPQRIHLGQAHPTRLRPQRFLNLRRRQRRNQPAVPVNMT